MHHLWDINELVRAIVLECSSSSTIVLARTSWVFFSVAADEIWGELENLKPLADLIKCHADEMSPEYASRRLARLQCYAGRVVALTLNELQADGARLHAILAFCLGQPVSSIFRRLKFLIIAVNTLKFLDDAVRFAFSSLTYLKLQIAPDGDCYILKVADIPVGADIPALASRLPVRKAECLALFHDKLPTLKQLDALEVYAHSEPEEHVQLFLSYVSRTFHAIREVSLDISPMSERSLSCINNLEKLETLKLTLPENEEMPRAWRLPNLLKIELNFTQFDPCFDFFSSMHAPLLECILLSVSSVADYYPTGPAHDFQRLSGVIATNQPLLQVYGLCGVLRMDDSSQQHHWTFDPFRPLLACHDLAVLTVRTDHRVLVNNRDLVHLSRSWPFLQSLILESPPMIPYSTLSFISCRPRATWMGLLFLARFCRMLVGLTLYVDLAMKEEDGQATAAAWAELVTIPSQSPLSGLHVEDCPACDAEAAADLLRKMFPVLKSFRYAPRRQTAFLAFLDRPSRTAEEERIKCMQNIATHMGLVVPSALPQTDVLRSGHLSAGGSLTTLLP